MHQFNVNFKMYTQTTNEYRKPLQKRVSGEPRIRDAPPAEWRRTAGRLRRREPSNRAERGGGAVGRSRRDLGAAATAAPDAGAGPDGGRGAGAAGRCA